MFSCCDAFTVHRCHRLRHRRPTPLRRRSVHAFVWQNNFSFFSFFLFHSSTSGAFLMTYRNFPFHLDSIFGWPMAVDGVYHADTWFHLSIFLPQEFKWNERKAKMWTKSTRRYHRRSIWICLLERIIDFVTLTWEFLVFIYSINTSQAISGVCVCVCHLLPSVDRVFVQYQQYAQTKGRHARKTNEWKKKSIKPKHYILFLSVPFFAVISEIKSKSFLCSQNLWTFFFSFFFLGVLFGISMAFFSVVR